LNTSLKLLWIYQTRFSCWWCTC